MQAAVAAGVLIGAKKGALGRGATETGGQLFVGAMMDAAGECGREGMGGTLTNTRNPSCQVLQQRHKP